MSKLTLWGWDKKKRTMVRFIKIGDVFCFQYDENTYCFGRIMSILEGGIYISEIFDYTSSEPIITEAEISNSKRMFHPINLDVYSLFDRKLFGDWRIIGKCYEFSPINAEGVLFRDGYCPTYKMDIYGNHTEISEDEAAGLPHLGFMYDDLVKEKVKENIGNETSWQDKKHK